MPTRSTLVHWRFDEATSDVRPSDSKGSVADLLTVADPVPVVSGVTGYARSFGPSRSFSGSDVVSGLSLATRDVTLQMLVAWDFDEQNVVAAPGTIVQRGASGSSSERVCFSLDVRVVNYALRVAEVRFVWETSAGVKMIQPGGHFIADSSIGWMMITATRHWISSTEVELQYYVGSSLVGEHIVPGGDIGGSTLGTMKVGAGLGGAFCGYVDELRVLNYHVTQEEVEATWLRLSKWQPSGYTTIRQLFQPRAPISDSPTSRVQRIFRGVGNALGYASAQVDNMRRNMMPDRAYGSVLERWEGITGEAPRALDTTKQRRSRVIGHLQQHQGSSPPGVTGATAAQLAVVPSQLVIKAFSNDWTEDFSGGTQLRWTIFNPGMGIVSNAWRMNLAGASDYQFTGMMRGNWRAMITSVQGNGRGSHAIAKLTPTTIGLNGEVGIFMGDWVHGNYTLFGIRNVAGVYNYMQERFQNGISLGSFSLGTTALVAQYLHLQQLEGAGGFGAGTLTAQYQGQWGATLAALASSALFNQVSAVQWVGLYARSIGGVVTTGIDVSWDDFTLRARYGERPFSWYVYRDPGLPGVPDLIGAQRSATRVAHAFTSVGVVANMTARCDSAASLCDNTPLGGI